MENESDSGRCAQRDDVGSSTEDIDLEANRFESARESLDEEPEDYGNPEAGTSSGKLEVPIDCRICLSSDDPSDLVAPCGCEGTVKYCHYACLEQWVKESRSLKCSVCCQTYNQPYRDRLLVAITKAELSMQETRDAELQLGGEVPEGQGEAGNTNRLQAKRLWCQMVIMIALSITLLYVIHFLLRVPRFSSWANMLLTIVSFILPFYLVGRAIVSLQRYRQERQFAYA